MSKRKLWPSGEEVESLSRNSNLIYLTKSLTLTALSSVFDNWCPGVMKTILNRKLGTGCTITCLLPRSQVHLPIHPTCTCISVLSVVMSDNNLWEVLALLQLMSFLPFIINTIIMLMQPDVFPEFSQKFQDSRLVFSAEMLWSCLIW